MAERRKVIKTSTPAEIRRTLGRISNMVLNGELDPKAANSIITACNAVLAGIRVDDQQRKLDELERLVRDSRR